MAHWADLNGNYIGVSPYQQDAAIEVPSAPAVPGCTWNGTAWTVTSAVREAARGRIDEVFAGTLDQIASPHASLNTLFTGQLIEAVLVTVRQAFDAAGVAAPTIPPATADQHPLLASLIGREPGVTDAATAAAHVLAVKQAWAGAAGAVNAQRLDAKAAVTAAETPEQVEAVLA